MQICNMIVVIFVGIDLVVIKVVLDSVCLFSIYQVLEIKDIKNGGFNVEKVEKLKVVIVNGIFQIDVDKIVDGVIDIVKNFISVCLV